MRREIRFGGYGGQGIALMGMLLGKAAAIYDKKEAVFTQSYGPESRGGASSADVVIDDELLDFPLVTKPNILVVMFQEAYQRFRPLLVKNGLLFIDADLVKPGPKDQPLFSVPATRLAEGLGKTLVANVVMLGFFTGVSGLVRAEGVQEAIRNSVRPKFVDLNLKAFEEGYQWAKREVLTQ